MRGHMRDFGRLGPRHGLPVAGICSPRSASPGLSLVLVQLGVTCPLFSPRSLIYLL